MSLNEQAWHTGVCVSCEKHTSVRVFPDAAGGAMCIDCYFRRSHPEGGADDAGEGKVAAAGSAGGGSADALREGGAAERTAARGGVDDPWRIGICVSCGLRKRIPLGMCAECFGGAASGAERGLGTTLRVIARRLTSRRVGYALLFGVLVGVLSEAAFGSYLRALVAPWTARWWFWAPVGTIVALPGMLVAMLVCTRWDVARPTCRCRHCGCVLTNLTEPSCPACGAGI